MAAATATATATAAIAATLFILLSVSINAQLPPVGVPMGTLEVPPPVMAPSPGGLDCMSLLFNMSDCLSYVEAGSNLTKPDKPCCPELAGLVDSHPICLCQLLGNQGSLGIDIDLKKAINLPKVCKVTIPPVSLCAATGVPVGVPTPSKSPASSSPSSSPTSSPSSPSSLSSAPSLSPEGLQPTPSSINKDSYGVRSNEATLYGLIIVISIPLIFFF